MIAVQLRDATLNCVIAASTASNIQSSDAKPGETTRKSSHAGTGGESM
jgi:hypothetical protein